MVGTRSLFAGSPTIRGPGPPGCPPRGSTPGPPRRRRLSGPRSMRAWRRSPSNLGRSGSGCSAGSAGRCCLPLPGHPAPMRGIRPGHRPPRGRRPRPWHARSAGSARRARVAIAPPPPADRSAVLHRSRSRSGPTRGGPIRARPSADDHPDPGSRSRLPAPSLEEPRRRRPVPGLRPLRPSRPCGPRPRRPSRRSALLHPRAGPLALPARSPAPLRRSLPHIGSPLPGGQRPRRSHPQPCRALSHRGVEARVERSGCGLRGEPSTDDPLRRLRSRSSGRCR